MSVRCNLIKSEVALKSVCLLLENNTKLENIQLTNNLIDEKSINSLYIQSYLNQKQRLNMDIFPICYFNSKERLDRCVWITSFGAEISKKDI